MKKLDKFQINIDKLINKEELTTLKGGYGEPCTCTCIPGGYVFAEYGDCGPACYEAFGSGSYGSC